MLAVLADLETCQGYASCVESAPDAFDIGDGVVVIVRPATVPDGDRARLEAAVQSCPVAALSVQEV